MSSTTFNYQSRLIRPKKNNARKLGILLFLFVLCALFYYFGELADFAGWGIPRSSIFYGVHDVHRFLFLAPIIYAGYFFGARAAIIITIIAVNTFLPRALFISPYPDPILRPLVFIILAGVIGYLTGSESERRRRLEALMRSGRHAMLEVLERMEEGVIIVGPDSKIRFINPSMREDLGEGIGANCLEYLHSFDALREQICKVPDTMSKATEKWEHTLPDGRTYEIVATPFLDTDLAICKLITFRNISRGKTS